MNVSNMTISVSSVAAIVIAAFGMLAYLDDRHVSIDAYAADSEQLYRRDLEQNVNLYQMQKTFLYSQRRNAPEDELSEINDEIEMVNDQLKSTRQQLQQLESTE